MARGLLFLDRWRFSTTRIMAPKTVVIHIGILGLSLMTFGTRSFGFPVTVLAFFSDSPLPLTFMSTTIVKGPWLAVDTVVHIRYSLVRVIAENVLPCLAPFAEDRIAIIFLERANAFDGVRFFIGCAGVRGGTVDDGRGAAMGVDLVGIRCGVRDGEGGGICHSLTDDPLSGHDKMGGDKKCG